MAYSNNQVRHLFVASDPKTASATVSDLGDMSVYGVAGQYLYFKHYGQGGVTCTDKIDVANILYAKLTDGTKLKTPLHKNTVAVSTATVGQVYTVKVLCRHYIGIGERNTETIVGSYRAKTGDNANAIAKGLRISLRSALGFMVADTMSSEANSTNTGNINNYKEQLFTVTGSSANIVISEVEGPWELGKFPAGHVVTIDKDAVFLGDIADAAGVLANDWGTVTYAANGYCDDAGKKLADLEYFCMGNRGDQYRGMGYPYNLDTKYMVNPSNTYDVIDIHYAYVGANESVQKSEKDITILVPHENVAFASSIDAMTGFKAGDPRRLIPAAGITPTPTSLEFTAATATKTVTATSDSPVTASADVAWLTVSVSGSTVSVTAEANDAASATARTGNVIIMNADGTTVQVPVSQAA